jgi:hypothetical protein
MYLALQHLLSLGVYGGPISGRSREAALLTGNNAQGWQGWGIM